MNFTSSLRVEYSDHDICTECLYSVLRFSYLQLYMVRY